MFQFYSIFIVPFIWFLEMVKNLNCKIDIEDFLQQQKSKDDFARLELSTVQGQTF